jgi:hypothetical protein
VAKIRIKIKRKDDADLLPSEIVDFVITESLSDVPIYIGDTPLAEDEYIDSGTGKIYRMVGGVLTPVDPPMPFPALPTSAGSTTINWRGEGLAPSEFDSIQEWVDIATYTYTNGEWV